MAKIFWLLSLFLWQTLVQSFNLYLPTSEVRNLLGLSRELFYVRNGVYNRNAIDYSLEVSPHVEQIHFAWNNMDNEKVQQKPDNRLIG